MGQGFKSIFAASLISTVAITAATTGCASNDPIEVQVIPPQEAMDIKENTALTMALQAKRKLDPAQNELLRGVHPKSHGCVDATFKVVGDIGKEYRTGLFAKPATYKAKIRYSNASVRKLPDLDGWSADKVTDGNGSRGMAIKVLGVDGPILLADGKSRNQDFLMVNTPEFAFANVRDYLRLTRILMLSEFGDSANPYFIPVVLMKAGLLTRTLELKPLSGNEPDKLKKAYGLYKHAKGPFQGFNGQDLKGTGQSGMAIANIRSRPVRNPLQISYFSASPFRYGTGRVMQFFVEPVVETSQTPFTADEAKTLDPNYLAKALKASMLKKKGESKDPIEFNFMVRVIDKSQLDIGGPDMIENAAMAWDEKTYPTVKFQIFKVATVSIPAIDETGAPDFVDNCKSLRFTPWHGLEAHEPLGGINRLRKPVYCASGEFRGGVDADASAARCRG